MNENTMNESNKIAKSTVIIILFSLGSKFLGFIREVLIASKFGSGMETDTFFVAITATTLVSNLVINTIKTVFIPILSEIDCREGHKGKVYHTNNMINIISMITVILVVVGWITTPVIVKLLAKGFYDEQYRLAKKLVRIGLPMIIISGTVGALTGFLQSEEIHKSSAAIGIPSNLVYIFYLSFLSSNFGIKGLMVAAVVAVLSQLLIQLPESKEAGYSYKFIFDVNDKYIIKLLHLSIPVLIGVAINDLNAIVDRTIASSLVSGSISALSYASKLNGLILGVFISAITTVIFPLLAKESNNDNIEGMKRIISIGVNIICLISIPASVGLIVLSRPIVQIAFQRGEFDANATIMTSQALVFYSIGLVSMAMRLLLNRVFYSLQDTKTPMINGAISVGVNIFLNLILVQFMGHAGLAFATSIATTIATILMFYSLKKKIGSLGTLLYIKCGLKVGLASAIMGLIAYVVYHKLYTALGVSKLNNLISLLVAVGIGIMVYGILCYIFGIKEVKELVDKVKKKIIKV